MELAITMITISVLGCSYLVWELLTDPQRKNKPLAYTVIGSVILFGITLATGAEAGRVNFHGDTNWGFSNAEIVKRISTNPQELFSEDEIRVVKVNDGADTKYIVVIQGIINSKVVNEMDRLLPQVAEQNKKLRPGTNYAVLVFLHSGGGEMMAGIELGNIFKKNQVQTIVPGDSYCASACAIAFMGGLYRDINSDSAYILFHAPYLPDENNRCLTRAEAPDLVSYINSLEIGQATRNAMMTGNFYCAPYGGKKYYSGSIFQTK